MLSFSFTSTTDLQEKVAAALDAAESRARARLLPRERLQEAIELVASTPCGYVHGDGGHVAIAYRNRADTTYFSLGWYTWRGQKRVALSAYRSGAKKVRYGASGYLSLDGSRKDAYSAVLPDRYRRYRYLRTQRQIAVDTRHLPPAPVELTSARLDLGGLVVAEIKNRYSSVLVGTPAGWLEVPRHADRKRSAWLLLSDLGISIPRLKKNRVWSDELTAAVTLEVISR